MKRSLVISLVVTVGHHHHRVRGHARGGVVPQARPRPGRGVRGRLQAGPRHLERRDEHHRQHHPQPRRRRRGVGSDRRLPGRQRRRAVPGREGPAERSSSSSARPPSSTSGPCCAGPRPTRPRPRAKTAPTGPLPSCGQYATTAANLAVNTTTGEPANNIPPNPAFAPYPIDQERRPASRPCCSRRTPRPGPSSTPASSSAPRS